MSPEYGERESEERTHAASWRDEEIDLRRVATILYRYRRSILFITAFFVLFTVIALYFKPSVYEAKSLLKSTPEVVDYVNLFPESARSELRGGIGNELPIFKSRIIADRVLETLKLGTRYYSYHHWKKEELYKKSPFLVTVYSLSPELKGKEFTVLPVDGKHFRLELTSGLWTRWTNVLKAWLNGEETVKKIHYEALHRYGEEIRTPDFVLRVRKLGEMLPGERYGFSVVPNHSMASFVQSGISASARTKGGEIFSLTFRDTVPERAVDILKQVIQAYIQSNMDYQAQSAAKQLEFIERQLQRVDRRLKASSKKLEDFKSSNVIVNLDKKMLALAQRQSEYESRLYEINIKIANLKSLLERLKEKQPPEQISADFPQTAGPLTLSLLQQLQEALSTYRALRVSYTKQYPRIQALEERITALRASIRDAIESNLLDLEYQKETLHSSIEIQKKKMENFPEEEQKLGELTRVFMVNKKVYSFLLEKRAEMQIDRSSIVGGTRILDPASLSGKVLPRRKLIILVGLILGLIVGMAQAFAREILGGRVTAIEELKKQTDIPVYATLPEMKSTRSYHHYLEAMRGLWVNLAFLETPSDRGKVLCITSTVQGEGKTLTAANLARTMAKGGSRVLVVDLDMRRSKLHKVLEVDNEIGMSTLLARQCTVDEVIRQTGTENLYVIPSGPQSENPVSLILSSVLDRHLEILSKRYDYVILDTPPVGLVSDAVKVIRLSDLTLFVMRMGFSKKNFIEEIEELKERECGQIALILNGIQLENEYGYYRHYEYLDKYLVGQRKQVLIQ